MKTFLASLFLGMIFLPTCFSGTIDPHIDDNKYVEYGKKFHYVYEMCGTYHDQSIFCASAVAIDKNWILTAAHVVKNAKICLAKQDDRAHIIRDIIVHPEFEDDKFGKADIALCYIGDDLGLDFYPPLYEQDDEVGKICSISGWGLTGTFNTGISRYDGKRRAGSNYIDKTYNDLLICSPSIQHKKTSLEYIICSGDSGGGLFIGNKLAGINSCVLAGPDKKPNSNYGDEAGHTRVSLFVNWIRENIKKKATE